MSIKARRGARIFAMQALYQWYFSSEKIELSFLEFLFPEEEVDKKHFMRLVDGVYNFLDAIDQEIIRYSHSRKLDDIDPLELSILRVSTYELLYCNNVPMKVSLNEALEMAKTYGSKDSYKFVNSILDQIMKSYHKDNRS